MFASVVMVVDEVADNHAGAGYEFILCFGGFCTRCCKLVQVNPVDAQALSQLVAPLGQFCRDRLASDHEVGGLLGQCCEDRIAIVSW